MAWIYFSSDGVTKVSAIPPLPARAVRPTRCIYSFATWGTLWLITSCTAGMSRPVKRRSLLSFVNRKVTNFNRVQWLRRSICIELENFMGETKRTYLLATKIKKYTNNTLSGECLRLFIPGTYAGIFFGGGAKPSKQ